jgi:predicted O-linked N-acetylglucosamine transferase (SPINDLY family)
VEKSRIMSKSTGQRALDDAQLLEQNASDASSMLDRALALHRAGSIADAQALYRQILQLFPNHVAVLQLLGMAESQIGRHEEADCVLRQALDLDPRSAALHSDRGVVLRALRRLDEALASCDTALAIEPSFAKALGNRGNVLFDLGRYEEALASHDRAIALKPDYAEGFSNRANALRALRRTDEALASCDRAIELNPRYAEALHNRGTALFDLRRFEEAVASYDAALSVRPDCADIWGNRGEALFALERTDEALASHDRALAIDRRLAISWLGRANILTRTKGLADAFAACNSAVAVAPDSPTALTLLGQCYGRQGDMEQAVACYDRALAIKPDYDVAISSKIFMLDFDGNVGFAEHQAARAQWWQQVGSKLAARSPVHHDNDRDPARRLVLGYVSSDFKKHSAAFGFSPMLKCHDRTRFEVICYSCSSIEDVVTKYFQEMADKWRSASQWSDTFLADQIRADKIDILIDLSGHSAGHRLGVFARKPAPIQVTAWGHATGTGIPTIDYLFSDPVAIPSAVRHLFAEKIYDLPCLVIIEPPPPELLVPEPPLLSKGHMTYGVFNRIDKISDNAVRVWARILQSDIAARLLIKHQAVDDSSIRGALTDRFVRHGVSADRIDMLGATERAEHVAAYGQVDVCLDPFPHSGGVSTWEALHAGVPVVAKLGNGVSSRLSGAILSAIGMTEWIAADDDEYVEIASRCASMPERLRTLRQELPARIATSSGCDPAGYARAVEAAYRAMWEEYCARAT